MSGQQIRYGLTPSQKGMADLHEFCEGTSAATLCGAVIYDEKMKPDLIDEAIRTVIRRNEAIRLRITREDGRFVQRISDEVDHAIEHMTLSSEDEVREFGRRDGRTVFEPDGGKMYRFTVLDLPDRTGIMITMSHMIIDSWGYSLIVREFYRAYKALCGDGDDLKEARRYTDYFARVEGYEKSSAKREDIKYWTESYSEGLSRGSIGHASGDERDISSRRYVTDISDEVSSKMKSFISEYKSSAPVLFEVATLIYLSLISRVDKNVTIGTPVLGRSGVSEKETVGMFMSTIPLSLDIGAEDTVLSLCEETSRIHRSIFRHGRLSREEIAKSIRSSCGYGGRLYDILVNYQNSTTDVPCRTIWFSTGFTEVPLAIHIDDRDSNGSYRINADYQIASFPMEEEVALLIRRLEHILKQIADDPGLRVRDISLIPPSEEHFLLEECNDTAMSYPKDRSVGDVISGYAKAHPDKIALIFGGKTFTYEDLDKKSDALASELISRGLGPGDVVPLISVRSPYVLIAMLAVLKTGAAYMPVSPDYPGSRIELMCRTVGAKIALTCGCSCDAVPVLDLESFEYVSREYERPFVDPDSICYVIFTSGSTGEPKATAVTHGNVLNYCTRNNVNVCGKILDEGDKSILSVTNIVFDIFVTESLLALMNGIRIVLADDSAVMSGKLLAPLVSSGVDVIQTTPTKMRSYLLDKDFRASVSSIRKILLGGEELTPSLLSDLRSLTSASVYNVYGPAETTVWSSLALISGEDIHIGRPVANTYIYILDEDLSLCPAGVMGEIVISGNGVGKGYLNNSKLTSEKFVHDPFRAGNTMYRTGDMGRMRPDGNIEFCGRRDNQIKLRGLRIELGEIECAMSRQEGVDLAAAVCRKDSAGEPYIAAFYTSDGTMDETSLKDILSRELPPYMVPKVIKKLDKMPMTASGKTDRKALPEVSFTASDREYVAPSSDMEEKLCAIFREVLKLPRVGVTDDFFDIGGDSFAAMESVSAASDRGIDIAVKDLYTYRDVRALAEHLGTASADHSKKRDYDIYPLTLKGIDRVFFKAFSSFSRHAYDFRVEGLENIPSTGCIFCPNHETMADPLWVWTALGKELSMNDISTVADEGFLKGSCSKVAFRSQGGIPVDRSGDFTGSLKRAEEVIAKERKYLLIHPEGTRTRTGDLGEFRKGAALIGIASGVPIVPVCIKGAGKIYPVGRKLPKIFGRLPLTVSFGSPVSCEGKSAEEITSIIKERITQMRDAP